MAYIKMHRKGTATVNSSIWDEMQETNSSLVRVAVAQAEVVMGQTSSLPACSHAELFSLVYCTSWQLKSKLSLLPKVLSGHNYHKPACPER